MIFKLGININAFVLLPFQKEWLTVADFGTYHLALGECFVRNQSAVNCPAEGWKTERID